MAWPNGLAFVAVQIVHHHQLVRPERGNEHFLDVGAEAFAVDRTVDEPRRLDAVVAKRGGETKVMVFQWPWGTLATSHSPRRAQPRSGSMLVFVHVSSMNTRRLGSIPL